MKKRSLKQIISLVLVFIMLISTPIVEAQTTKTDSISRANLKFDEMKYEHIEYAEVQKLLDELEEILNKNDEEAYYKWDQSYYQLYCKVNTMIEIAQLHYMLDMSKQEYFKEYLYSMDLIGKMRTNYAEIFEDENAQYSKNMDKYYKLTIERSKLVDAYYSQEMNTKVEKDNKSMTIVDILHDTTLTNEQVYKLYEEWYTIYNKKVGEILLNLVKIDNQIAKIQGFDTYVECVYHSYSRDYTPQQAETFIKNVKEIVPTTYAKLYKSNLVASYILEGYSCKDDESLLKDVDEGFISKFPQLQEAFEYMKKYQLYDIDYRSGKTTGGFTKYFLTFQEPFIVLNYGSAYQTALSFIHEFGHYFSYYKIGTNAGGLDLDETYSQALELLAMPYYNEIFKNDKYSKAAKVYTVGSMLEAIIQGCLYDEFLREVYKNPNITVEQMNELYSKLATAYGLNVDGRSWCNVAHNFEAPFYYISYSVSAVAAMEIWNQSLNNEEDGMQAYLKLVEAGKSNTFIKSVKAAGIASPMERASLEKVMTSIEKYFEPTENQTTEITDQAA